MLDVSEVDCAELPDASTIAAMHVSATPAGLVVSAVHAVLLKAKTIEAISSRMATRLGVWGVDCHSSKMICAQ